MLLARQCANLKITLLKHIVLCPQTFFKITSKVLKFADDTKVFRKIKSDADRQHLQDDLNKLIEWSEKWQMLESVSAFTQDMAMKMHNIQWVILY